MATYELENYNYYFILIVTNAKVNIFCKAFYIYILF